LHDPNFKRFCLIHPCDRRTDGREHIRAVSYYAVARKNAVAAADDDDDDDD